MFSFPVPLYWVCLVLLLADLGGSWNPGQILRAFAGTWRAIRRPHARTVKARKTWPRNLLFTWIPFPVCVPRYLLNTFLSVFLHFSSSWSFVHYQVLYDLCENQPWLASISWHVLSLCTMPYLIHPMLEQNSRTGLIRFEENLLQRMLSESLQSVIVTQQKNMRS